MGIARFARVLLDFVIPILSQSSQSQGYIVTLIQKDIKSTCLAYMRTNDISLWNLKLCIAVIAGI